MAKWSTKNPPEKSGMYFVTIICFDGTPQTRQAKRAQTVSGDWGWYLLPEYGFRSDEDVIAWQKCPKPYVKKEE